MSLGELELIRATGTMFCGGAGILRYEAGRRVLSLRHSSKATRTVEGSLRAVFDDGCAIRFHRTNAVRPLHSRKVWQHSTSFSAVRDTSTTYAC